MTKSEVEIRDMMSKQPFTKTKEKWGKLAKKIAEFVIIRGNDLGIVGIDGESEVDGFYWDFVIHHKDYDILIDLHECVVYKDLSDKIREENYTIIIDGNTIDHEEVIAVITTFCGYDYDELIQSIYDGLPWDFPYQNFEDDALVKDYVNLVKLKDPKARAKVGDKLISHFHKSIFHARNQRSVTPVEGWMDKDLLMKIVKNRFIYSKSLDVLAIQRGFTIAKAANKVSVFSCALAKHIISTYLDEYKEITDPFSGFSGRMVGAVACGKDYVGHDINQDHVNESNEIIDFLYKNKLTECNMSVTQKDLFQTEEVECECIFTCSPYRLKEIWNEDETDLSCDEWIDEVMKRYKAKRYVFVVDETEKWKDHVVEEISNKSHFSNNTEKILVIDA